MAALNLIPNPSVLVVQAGIFLANIVIVKKLMLEPYLSVRDRRNALTVGSRDEAERASKEAEEAAAFISKTLTNAASEAKHARDKVRDAALVKKSAIVEKAEAEARSVITAAEGEIKANLTTEKAKIPSIVKQLTDEVYRAALA